MPINYQLSKIYKLESPNGLIYIGSTSEPTLARRLAGHKQSYKNWKGGYKKNYISSFKLFDEDENNILIYLIENFPCNNKDELRAREGFYIKKYNCVNINLAGRTEKIWKSENKKEISEKGKIYRINNSYKLTKKNICECGGKYQTTHKSAHIKTKKHLNYIEIHK